MANGTRTVRFTPQFIETDAGVLERALQSREQAYLQGLQLATAAEEKFGEAPVVAGDLEARDVLSRQFSDDIADIVNKTAGKDYGAAIPQILQRAAQQKKQGFYQQANQRYARQQEIQKAADALRRQGHRPVYTGELGQTATVDPLTGEVVLTGQDVSEYDVIKGTEWSPYVRQRFPSVQNRLNQILLDKSRIPGQLEMVTKYGADSLSDAEWNELLSPEAIQQFGEDTTFFLENPNATAADAKEFLKRNIKEQFGRDPQSTFMKAPEAGDSNTAGGGVGTLPYFTAAGTQKKIKENVKDINKPLNKLEKAYKALENSQKDIDVVAEAERLGISPDKVETDLAKLNQNTQLEYNSAVAEFKKIPAFESYTQAGLTDLEAAKAITKQKEKAATTRLFPNVFKPYDKTTILPALKRELLNPALSDVNLLERNKKGEIVEYDVEWFSPIFGRYTGINEVLSQKDAELVDMGIDFSTNQLEVRVKVGTDRPRDIRIPISQAVENDQIRQSIDMMGNAIKAYQGELGPGVYPVGANLFTPAYVLEMAVNPDTREVENNVYQIVYKNGQPVGKRRSNIQELMSEGVTGIFDAWGKAPEYTKSATGKPSTKVSTVR